MILTKLDWQDAFLARERWRAKRLRRISQGCQGNSDPQLRTGSRFAGDAVKHTCGRGTSGARRRLSSHVSTAPLHPFASRWPQHIVLLLHPVIIEQVSIPNLRHIRYESVLTIRVSSVNVIENASCAQCLHKSFQAMSPISTLKQKTKAIWAKVKSKTSGGSKASEGAVNTEEEFGERNELLRRSDLLQEGIATTQWEENTLNRTDFHALNDYTS